MLALFDTPMAHLTLISCMRFLSWR